MKICFFIATLDNSGGTERALTAVANELLDFGYDISIICWCGGKTSFFPLDERIAVHYLYEQKQINIYTKYLPSLARYTSLIRKIKPEVIIDVCVPLSLITIPATAFSKVKTVSWEQFNVKVSWNFFTAKMSRWLASKQAQQIVVLTNTDKQEYKRRFNTNNQYIIPNPVSMKVIETSGLKTKNILAVGRLTHQKGFDLLLQAWHKVSKSTQYAHEINQWKLIIVGGGEDEFKLKKLCSDLELNSSVVFNGPTKHIEGFYTNASIFVMSSRFEGLPLALVEAKAFGLPTISFDCETGPREVISHEVDGLLVEANNDRALADAIIRLINNPVERECFGAMSVEKAKKFALGNIVKSWDDLIRNTLK